MSHPHRVYKQQVQVLVNNTITHIFPWKTCIFRGHLTLELSCIWVNRVQSLDQSFSTTGVQRVGWLFVKLFEKYTKIQTIS